MTTDPSEKTFLLPTSNHLVHTRFPVYIQHRPPLSRTLCYAQLESSFDDLDQQIKGGDLEVVIARFI